MPAADHSDGRIGRAEQAKPFGLRRRTQELAREADGGLMFAGGDDQRGKPAERRQLPLLAQSPRDFDLSGYVRFWLNSAERPTGNIRVQVDIDPMSFYLWSAHFRPATKRAEKPCRRCLRGRKTS
jgi:hypothetical protein